MLRQLKIGNTITPREDRTQNYLDSISHIPLLSVDDEVELSERIKAGDEQAYEKLVRSNLRFVVSVAKQYLNQGLPFNDLINEGNIGLMKAARTFDHTRGFKFISYAVWWIRQSILMAITIDGRLVRVPLNKFNQLTKLHRVQIVFFQKHGHEASVDQLSILLGRPAFEISALMELIPKPLSLDVPLKNDKDGDERTLTDLLPSDEQSPDKDISDESLTHDLKRALRRLGERERDMVIQRFGLFGHFPLSYDEIGKKYDLQAERVRQIVDASKRKLSNIALLRQYY